jgi:hypothetical protein
MNRLRCVHKGSNYLSKPHFWIHQIADIKYTKGNIHKSTKFWYDALTVVTNTLRPWNSVLLQKLRVTHLVNECTASCPRWIPSTPSYPVPFRSILYNIPLSNLRYSRVPFTSGCSTKTAPTLLLFPERATLPALLILLEFITLVKLDEEYKQTRRLRELTVGMPIAALSLKRRVLTIWYFHIFCLLTVRREGVIQSS